MVGEDRELDVSSATEGRFNPGATSMAENFLESMKYDVFENGRAKRKKEAGDVGAPEAKEVIEEKSDENETPEEAKHRKDLRRHVMNQMAVERDLNLAFDPEETMVEEKVESTQHIDGNLAAVVNDKEKTFEDLSQESDNSEEMEVTNINILQHNMQALEKMLEEKGTKIDDLNVQIQECNHMIDERDKTIRDKLAVIKIKNEEIKDEEEYSP